MYKCLDRKRFDRILHTALKILSEIGIELSEKATVKLLKEHGCTDTSEGRISFPSNLVCKAVESVPDTIRIFDLQGNLSVEVKKNSDRNFLAAGLNCVNFFDRETKKQRQGTLDDIKQAAKLCERLERIDMAAAVCTASDIEPEIQAVSAAAAVTENTSKPVAFTAHDEKGARQIWAHLASEAGGMQALTSRPCGLDLTGPTSPLRIGSEAVLRLRYAAANGLPVVCYPGIIPGAASPVTLAGTLAQSGAEILAGIVIHQLENPGAPVLSGSAILPMDMRTGTITYGSPEYATACTAAVDFFNYLGIPSWAGGGCSDSASPDVQAAAEAQLTMNAAVKAETSFIHNAGYLSSGRCASLEMLVLADELIRINEEVNKAPDCSDDALGFTLIRDAAAGSDYMGSEHTLKYMRESMYYSPLFRSNDGPLAGDSENPFNEKIESIIESIL